MKTPNYQVSYLVSYLVSYKASYLVSYLVIVPAALVLMHCAAPLPPDAVAVWDGGLVTASEVEARILELPVEQRRPEDGDFTRWHARLAEEIAVEKILAKKAIESGLAEEAETRAEVDEAVREMLAGAYLSRHMPALEPVTDQDVAAAYEERKEQFKRPAQRQVLHIFKRKTPDKDSEAIRRELLEIRQRALKGESFQLMARELSESETRHRDGFMGSFRLGQLPSELERIVFALPAKVPSEPVLTPQGGHLFWVETAIEARDFELADVQRKLAEEIRESRRDEAIDAMTADYELPEGSYLPNDEDLRILLSSGDPRTLVLRIGEYELRFLELRELLAAELAGEDSALTKARRLVDRLHRRERLVDAARRSEFDQQPEVHERLERLRQVQLARLQAERSMRAAVADREAEVRSFYDNNRARYTEPLRLKLKWMTVPISDPLQAAEHMAQLERAVTGRREDATEVAAQTQELVQQLGGQTETMDWMTFDVLRGRLPRVAEFVAPLSAGEMTPPFRSRDALGVLQVLERMEPGVLPFEAARERLVEDYLEYHGQEFYGELRDSWLTNNSYRPLESRLSNLSSSETSRDRR